MLEIRMLNKSCYFCTHNLNKVVLRAKERSHKENQQRERWFKSTRAREVKVLAAISLRIARREKNTVRFIPASWRKVSGKKSSLNYLTALTGKQIKNNNLSILTVLVINGYTFIYSLIKMTSDQHRIFFFLRLQVINVSIKNLVDSLSNQLNWQHSR